MTNHREARMTYLRQKAWTSSNSPIKRQRHLRGLSLTEAADAAQIARSTWIHAEAGGTVSDATIWAISSTLNVPREWLDPAFAARLQPGLMNCED